MPLDIFDKTELTAEDRVMSSDDFRKFMLSEIRSEVKRMGIDKIILAAVDKKIKEVVGNMSNGDKLVKEELSKRVEETAAETEKNRNEFRKYMTVMKGAIEAEMKSPFKKVDDDFASIRTSLRQAKDSDSALEAKIDKIKLDIADFMQEMKKKFKNFVEKVNVEPRYQFGGYPPPGGVLPIQSGGVDTWRIIIDGDDLSFQYDASGTWTEAFRVTRNQ